MPAYYAMGYLSGGLCNVPTIGEHPPAKTPNARAQALPKAGAQRTLKAVGCSALFGVAHHFMVLHDLNNIFHPLPDPAHVDGYHPVESVSGVIRNRLDHPFHPRVVDEHVDLSIKT